MIKTKNIQIKVRSTDEFFDELDEDLKKIDEGTFEGPKEFVSFSSLEQLRKFITPKRLQLLKIIKEKKPNSIYGLAKITNRPLKSINRDLDILKEIGLVELSKTTGKRNKVVPKVNYEHINIGIEI